MLLFELLFIYYCRHLTLSFFVSVHDQILFGAGDVDYCVLLGLASFMEYSIEQGWDQSSDHLFCLDGLNCPITIKDRVSAILSMILADRRLVLIPFASLLLPMPVVVVVPKTRLTTDFVGRTSGCKIATLRATLASTMLKLLLLCARGSPLCIPSRWKAIYPSPGF